MVRLSFNSRTPGGVRLPLGVPAWREVEVSIHAPREGCDARSSDTRARAISFNSRTPGGVRLRDTGFQLHSLCFNSRTPGGVRLVWASLPDTCTSVSIHAPREGCDIRADNITHRITVSIHAPREGCDGQHGTKSTSQHVSIHAPREGCDVTICASVCVHK